MPRHRAGRGDVLEAGPQGDYGVRPSVASEERPAGDRYPQNSSDLWTPTHRPDLLSVKLEVNL